jgi:hypothetical protein
VLFEIAARFVDQPIEQYRSFVDELLAWADRIPSILATNTTPERFELTLVISVDQQLVDAIEAEIRRIESVIS